MTANSDTFRSRLVRLVQKSRKALRLYTNVGKGQRGVIAENSESQVREWREVNAKLSRELTCILEDSAGRELSRQVFKLRDDLYTEWRTAQAALHDQQRSLIVSAESSDFIKACSLSRELVPLKARVQALQAAYHELQQVLDQSQVVPPKKSEDGRQLDSLLSESRPSQQQSEQSGGEALFGDSDFEEPEYRAKVIPLRRGDG
ncbi:MAG: hypothetical protein KDD64_04390 [Bdellovibrionales bacterium]|nr:hypothetical protein [Bdellovibrionales bacterium]